MPFTSAPSQIVRDDPRARAIAAAASDDSHSARVRTNPAIKFPCPTCNALPNERCYASRDPKRFARDYHAARRALVPQPAPEPEPAGGEPHDPALNDGPHAGDADRYPHEPDPADPESVPSHDTRAGESAAANAGEPEPAPQPAPKTRRARKTGDPRADRAARAAKSTTDAQQPAAPKEPAAPKPLNTAARKRIVAAALIRAGADLAASWEHDEITREDATAMISAWLNYVPGDAWDDRLNARSGAGKPRTTAKS